MPAEGALRADSEGVGKGISRVGATAREQDPRGAPSWGSRAHVHLDSTEVCSGAGDWFHQGKERHSYSPDIRWSGAELYGGEFLGARVLRLDGRVRREGDQRVHQAAGSRRQAA